MQGCDCEDGHGIEVVKSQVHGRDGMRSPDRQLHSSPGAEAQRAREPAPFWEAEITCGTCLEVGGLLLLGCSEGRQVSSNSMCHSHRQQSMINPYQEHKDGRYHIVHSNATSNRPGLTAEEPGPWAICQAGAQDGRR